MFRVWPCITHSVEPADKRTFIDALHVGWICQGATAAGEEPSQGAGQGGLAHASRDAQQVEAIGAQGIHGIVLQRHR